MQQYVDQYVDQVKVQHNNSQTYLNFAFHQVYTQYHYYHLLSQVHQNLYQYLHIIQFSLIRNMKHEPYN